MEPACRHTDLDRRLYGATAAITGDNGTVIGVKEPRGASLTPMAVPMPVPPLLLAGRLSAEDSAHPCRRRRTPTKGVAGRRVPPRGPHCTRIVIAAAAAGVAASLGLAACGSAASHTAVAKPVSAPTNIATATVAASTPPAEAAAGAAWRFSVTPNEAVRLLIAAV